MADVLLTGVRVLTSARGRVLKSASIVIDQGRVAEVSARKPDVAADITIDGQDKMIAVPGFVNAHVHTEETLWMNRVPDTLRHVPWWSKWIIPYYRSLGDGDAYWSTLLSHMIMLKGGTTCCADSANTAPELAAKAAERSGIRSFVARWNCDLGSYGASSIEDCMKETKDLLRKYSKGRVRAIASVIGANWCSDDMYRGMKELADERESVVTSHEASGHEDVVRSVKRTGRRPVEHLKDIGFLSPTTLLSHVTDISENEVAAIRKTRTSVALCPVAELKKGKGLSVYGKLPQVLSNGTRVCVGTDTANSSNHLDVLRTAGTLSLITKDFALDPEIFDARRALELITSEGGDCLGMRGYGSISVGRPADIAVFELDKLSWISESDVAQGLVYGNGATTYATIVDGRAAYIDGRFMFVDEAEVVGECGKRAKQIQRRVSTET